MRVQTLNSVFDVSVRDNRFFLNFLKKVGDLTGGQHRVPVGREFVGVSLVLCVGEPLLLRDERGNLIVKSSPLAKVEV
ncbi:MAG: hypothetical protein WAP51_01980 [Candidatus Sungiibacteriota bacterium]